MGEILTLGVGAAIGKAVFKSWLKDSEFGATFSENMVDVFRSAFTDRRTQSAASRQLERITERAADLLEPIITHEWKSLPHNEVEAAIFAVSQAIDSENLCPRTLVAIDFDPARLTARILTHLRKTDLSESGQSLADRLITEASQLIVDLSSTIEHSGIEALAEILRRESALIESLERIFIEFESIRIVSNASSSEASDSYFEETYRKAIGRQLDGIELFGIDSQTRATSRHHDLTTAYISLSVSPFDSSHETASIDASELKASKSVKNIVSIKVEDVASRIPRIILRGEAGSGKTTLLQSIAVRCATSSFAGEMEEWNTFIPFFIRLRAIGDEYPPPERFPSLVASSIAGTMPAGWVHRQLERGRAILLIDGVDEVSQDRREQAKKWVRELVGSYPTCRFIITTRPAAITDAYLKTNDFKHIDLLPMSPEDVAQFIEQWHSAVSKHETDQSKVAHTMGLPPRLIERIKSDPALRELAATPLLCAMLCAMNRDRKEVLPATRIALYEAAVSMIVHGRDEQRKIKLKELPDVDYDTKIALLQEVAFWMMQNSWSMAETWRLEEFVATIVQKYPRIGSHAATDVVSLLLQRSGVLRVPFEGRVDFIHNAFKEYLCAKAISASDRFGFLIQTLDNEAWREVATLAPALTDDRRRSAFLNDLLERGDNSIAKSSMYFLLAVRCLETCTELNPQTQLAIRERINKLRPPRTMGEAKALAGAGELALPLLDVASSPSARGAAACVRTLRYIGTSSALETLKGFAKDSRRTVYPEIYAAWPFFDRTEFAKSILAASPLLSKGIGISSLSMLEGVRHLTELKSLSIYASSFPLRDEHLNEIAHLKALTDLSFSRCEEINLSKLSGLQNLTELYVDSKKIDNLNSIQDLINLVSLTLITRGDLRIPDINHLSGLKKILLQSNTASFKESSSLPSSLQSLRISGIADNAAIDCIERLSDLRYLDIGVNASEPRLAALYKLPVLQHLGIRSNDEIASLSGISESKQLISLSLKDCTNLSNIEALAVCSNLRTIHLFSTPSLLDISSFAALDELSTLSLYIHEDASLDVLRQCRSLQRVNTSPRLAKRIEEMGLDIQVKAFFPSHQLAYRTSIPSHMH